MNNDDSYAEFMISRDRLTAPSPSVDPADALGEESLMGSPMPKDANGLPTDSSGDLHGLPGLYSADRVKAMKQFFPEMPQQTDVGLASTIGTNLKALPGAVARGGAAAIYETLFAAGGLTEKQVQQMRAMDKECNEAAVQRGANEMVVSGAQGLAQFGVGMFPAFKALRLAGLGRPAAALISEGLAGAFAFNPDDPNIGNFVQSLKPESPVIQNIANFIATDPNDTVVENRFRNALQDTIPSGIIESIIKVVKGVRGLDAETLIKKGEEAEARLNNLGNTLSANPVGPVADMAVAGVGKVAGAMQPQKPAPVFYSAVANAVDALPMEKGSAQQMRAMIAKSPEVKAEEMAWIGLDDFLKGKKSVTKQEIKDFVDANQVQIEEVVRADEGVTQEIGYLRRRHEMMVEGSGDYADLPPSLREERAAKMLADIEAMEASNVVGRPKFSPDNHPDLSLPGGENYREVLLRLPEKQAPQVEKYTVQENENGLFDIVNSRGELVEVEATREAAEDAARQFGEGSSIAVPGGSAVNFTGGHFDESNVLAHVRLNDRTGPNGEKILFVEEFQSDWHQRGQKRGYKIETSNLDKELASVEGQLDEFAPKSKANKDYIDAGGDRSKLPFPNIGHDIEILMDRRRELVSEMARFKDGVPDAPLKKTWQEMSFRRVARMAAEEGYDAIAWTPGKMQAERYDLSKQISEIDYDPDTKKLTAYEKDGYSPVIDEIVSEDKLADYIGKDVTEKLLATTRKTIPTDKGNTSQHSLKGADLQVGGKFHKDLYDKKIKQYADKWGKKFGTKVGVTDLSTGRRVDANLEVVDTPSGNFVVIDRINGGQLADFGNRQDAEAYVVGRKVEATGKTMEQVWTMPVTKKMKDSVLSKGVATFGASGLAIGMNRESENGN